MKWHNILNLNVSAILIVISLCLGYSLTKCVHIKYYDQKPLEEANTDNGQILPDDLYQVTYSDNKETKILEVKNKEVIYKPLTSKDHIASKYFKFEKNKTILVKLFFSKMPNSLILDIQDSKYQIVDTINLQDTVIQYPEKKGLYVIFITPYKENFRLLFRSKAGISEFPYEIDISEFDNIKEIGKIQDMAYCQTNSNFKIKILKEVPSLEKAISSNDIQLTVRLLREWTANKVNNLIGGANNSIIYDEPIEKVLEKLENKEIGFSCGGTAIFFGKILKYFGIPSASVNSGINGKISHVINIVDIGNGKVIGEDAFFNQEYSSVNQKLVGFAEFLKLSENIEPDIVSSSNKKFWIYPTPEFQKEFKEAIDTGNSKYLNRFLSYFPKGFLSSDLSHFNPGTYEMNTTSSEFVKLFDPDNLLINSRLNLDRNKQNTYRIFMIPICEEIYLSSPSLVNELKKYHDFCNKIKLEVKSE